MGTLSSLFDLSRTALLANQTALDVAANNVANQNTTGYVRQVVSWQAGDSVILSGGANVAYDGPVVTTSSKRDRVLEQRVQQQTQVQAETSVRANVLSQIEGVFDITGTSNTAGSTQIGTSLTVFFNSLTALSGNPADDATRQGVVSAAKLLASAFNAAATQLTQVTASVGHEIGDSVTAVNALTSTIAQLNGEISSNSPAGDAGTLEDQRQQAIVQLSQYVGLDQIATEHNGISLTTTGGSLLVAGTRAYSLTTVDSGSGRQVRDRTGMDVSGTISGGSMGGELTAQNTDLPTVKNALDALAYRIGTTLNGQNAAGIDATGAAGSAIFTLTASVAGAAQAITASSPNGGAIAAAAPGEGVLGNGNANALLDLAKATDASGQTMAGSLGSLLAQVGTQSSALGEQSTAQNASLTQLSTQRDRLSGVSLDEEAAHLSQYQRSYQAAAKLFSILNSLFAAAINLGQQTTVG